MLSTHDAAVPLPPDVSATVDPLLEVLSAFPMPQLLATSAPPERSGGVARGTSHALDHAVKGTVMESARTLMASSSYMALRRTAAEEGEEEEGGGDGSTPQNASHLSPLARRIHEELLRIEIDRLHGISEMRNAEAPSKQARWVHNAECHMTLRPRSALDDCGEKENEEARRTVKVPKREPNFSSIAPGHLHDAEFANAGPTPESYGPSTLSDIIDAGVQGPRALASLLGLLSDAPQPFKDVPADRLTAFVSSLLTLPGATATSSADFALPAAAMERAVTCCACIAHPTFDPSVLAEDAVDRLITILAALLRRIRRRQSGHVPDDAGAGTELECLRTMLRCFALMLVDTRLRLCAHGDLLRLEDLCFQCLFVVTSTYGRQEVVNYAAYVLSHALHLYSALWNRLECQREATWQRFFLRLPQGENLLVRLYLLPSGVKVTALTPAVVAAAQSTPVGNGAVTRGAAERLQQQCRVWSNMFFQHFLLEERDDKREREMCGAVVLQFCEDLANMVGLPEYPAADMLLRAFLVSFAHHCLSASEAEGLRTLFLDAIFRVSCVLFGPTQQTVLQSVFPEACELTDAQLRQWRQLTHPDEAAIDTEVPLSHDEMRQALLYMVLSHQVADPAPDIAATVLHLRAAHVYTWAIQDADRFPDAVVEALVHATQVQDGGVAVEWSILHACSAQLCASCDKSLLSAMANERLLSWLLSVVQLREEQHSAGLELARKKAIQYMGKLAAMHPPLLAKVWPIARRCVRDDSARVREAIVPLFLTLFSETCGRSDAVARVEETAAEVVSCLLHLLNDRSVAVVTRAIAALDTLLTDASLRHLLDTLAAGENLLTFTESKLLAFVGPGKETRHQTCVMRLFLRRWVGQEVTDVASHPVRARVARELIRLTVTNMTYPYEASESLHLVALLRGMCRLAEGRGTSRRTAKSAQADALELRGVMIGVAKVLWAEHQRLMPAPEAAAALTAVHALALACGEWVEPLLEVLAQTLARSITPPPPPSQPSSSSQVAEREAVGVTLLHVCRILRTVLLAPRAPPLALDPLARVLTTVLSRYVGPHQQQILVSASGVLAATITCGGDGLAGYTNTKYLLLCYSLMNTYYVRTMSFIPSLRTDLQSVAYTLRFLFLLSEFLRLYPAWKQHHQELTEETAVGGSGVSNQLALGGGICANVYAAVERVLQECPAEAQERTTVIALRVFASLCMLQPTIFFRRCEPYLRRALDPAGDLSLQSQGLVLIRDFLKDEDARVDRAAATNAPVPLPSAASSSSSPTARKRGRHDGLHVEAAPCVEEQNSGMATWVMQQFHLQILQLCEVSAVGVRQLAFEVLQLCAEGGLLPPSRYASALIVLAADPQNEALRHVAVECMASQSERYADVVAANAATGVIRAFDLHDACGVDVLQSAVLADTSLQAGECVHAHLFTSLRKRHREAFLSSLLRYFYQEARAAQWLREHRRAGGESARTPFPFLGHLTMVVAYLPYTNESDVLHVLDNCRAAVDLVGQSCLDFAEAQLSLLQSRRRPTHPVRRRSGTGGRDDTARQDTAVELWQCFGILCISHLRTFLCDEYGLYGAKLRRLSMRRRSGNTYHLTTLARREPQSAASVAFRQNLTALLRSEAPLWEGPPTDAASANSQRCSVEELCGALAGVVQAAEMEVETDGRGATRGSRGSTQLPRARSSRGTPPAGATEEDEEQPGRRRQRRMAAEEDEEGGDVTATTGSGSNSSSDSLSASASAFDDNDDSDTDGVEAGSTRSA
ncbi:hypothetical protein TraAM80_03517 [Trypanosoma rangeli]|uniref:Sister chromatid cohesion protein n=1 Tax=Trypanosoma rangeli TaxID=5698 RepID=A0A3S5IRK1_TRYRA|nr:uncharacterized protein TraAM80_03517 [Trypanosoma rangeli]RNF07224.1 hypothetical protein TraAM80_03517 [Trypanosoma rangeli]|eukprot:RNF07224.1 hypothetical protein TraAM80_03517 [Trypanosoma rangeli]